MSTVYNSTKIYSPCLAAAITPCQPPNVIRFQTTFTFHIFFVIIIVVKFDNKGFLKIMLFKIGMYSKSFLILGILLLPIGVPLLLIGIKIPVVVSCIGFLLAKC